MPQLSVGPAPPMPPHGSADPNAPNYNPERARMADELGPEGWNKLTSDWQRWAAEEDRQIGNLVASGYDLTDIQDSGGSYYENRPEHGASKFAEYTPERVAQLRKDDLARLIYYGHFTLDPKFGLYRSGGVGASHAGEQWKDPSGNIVGAPPGAYSGPNAASYDINPYNNQQNQQQNAAPTGVTKSDKAQKTTVKTGWETQNTLGAAPAQGAVVPTTPGYASSGPEAPSQTKQQTNPWDWV